MLGSQEVRKSREVEAYQNLFIWYLNWGSRFWLTPYEWDLKRGKFRFTRRRWGYFAWEEAVQVLTTALLYSTYRLVKEFFVPDPNFATYKVLLYFLYYMILAMCLIYEYTLLFYAKKSIRLVNSFVDYEYALAEILASLGNKFDRKARREFKTFRLYIGLMTLLTFSAAILIPLQFTLSTDDIDPLNRFMKENFTPDFYDAYFVKGVFFIVFVILAGHICGSCMFGTFVIMLFVVRLRRHFRFLLLQDPNQLLRNHPMVAIKMYRCCEWITRDISDWSYFVTPALLFSGNLIHSLSIFCAMKLYGVMPLPTYVSLAGFAVGLCFFEGTVIPMMAAVLEKSSSVSEIWAKASHQQHVLKAFKSLRPFGFDVAGFFTVQKDTVKTYGLTVIDNTVNLVLGVEL